jgi:hypothetical protein
MYKEGASTISIGAAGTYTTLPVSASIINGNFTADFTNNRLTVTDAGTYEISYDLSAYTTISTALSQMTSRIYNVTDGVEVTNSKAVIYAAQNQYFKLHKTFIATLGAGDNYRLELTDLQAAGAAAGSSCNNVSFTFKKISN